MHGSCVYCFQTHYCCIWTKTKVSPVSDYKTEKIQEIQRTVMRKAVYLFGPIPDSYIFLE